MRRRARTIWIADESVLYEYPDGDRVKGRIAIGRPYRFDTYARCPISLDGFGWKPPDREIAVAGETTLQALLLAARFLGHHLHDFTSKGGRVLTRLGRTPVPLEAYFGPLLRHAGDDVPKTKRAPRPKPKRARERVAKRRRR